MQLNVINYQEIAILIGDELFERIIEFLDKGLSEAVEYMLVPFKDQFDFIFIELNDKLDIIFIRKPIL